MVLLFFIFAATAGYSQSGNAFVPTVTKYILPDTSLTSNEPEPEDEYEQILITLNVQRIGSLEIPAIVYGRSVYLSVKDLFDFLKVRNYPTNAFDSISGFFINPKSTYLIDKSNNKITYNGRIYKLKPNDLINDPTTLYLKSDYFGQIFGLDCAFDFRSLTVTLSTKLELPAIREMQLELMRRNMSQLKGEKKADTVIRRSFPLFHIGVADWSVTGTQQTQGRSNTRANLGIGALALGGELNLSLNYNSDEKINLRQQYYQWRYVNNDLAAIKQVTLGKIFAQSVSSIYAPVNGLQITNTPTTYRRSFGTYTLSNTTEPDWTVELYVNNVLINYTKADGSGFYSFEVPMLYGNSVVKLRFYGPWGEEQTTEKYISIPFNFIPFRKLEYNVTGGVVNDAGKGLYARAAVNYGLGRRITIGGGVEYLSTVTSGKFMPFVNTSLSLGQHFLFSGEYVYGVRSKEVLSYRAASNLQVDASYTKYDKAQTAVMFSYLDEKKVVVSMPFRAKRFTAYSRLTLNQFTLPYSKGTGFKSKYTSAEFLLSAVVVGVSSNLTTYAILSTPGNPLVYSNLSLTFRLPANIRFTPQAQYEYRTKNFSMIKAAVEKSIFNRGFLNIAYEKNFANTFIITPTNTVSVGLRYNFSFAQTFFSATSSRNVIATTQGARGSLVYDGKTNYLGALNQSSVGRGGIVILPFLDLNCNGKHDAGEPRVLGLNLRVNGGRIERNDRDTTIRINGLEAYTNYFIELDKNGFDNVAWQIKKQTLSVTIEPNNLKLIEVAVAVVGEVAGTVFLKDVKGKNGLGRIIVNIYDSNLKLAGKTLTEADGYFSFMGLAPGSYTAMVDPLQMEKLQMRASPVAAFTIAPKTDGDVADGLQFILQAKE
ncbi:MAG: hypothetical protein ABI685_10090 [Ferruginibacter sp.]